MSLEPTPGTSAAEFAARLLHFINCELPRIQPRAGQAPWVAEDTPLFATGLLDSLSILHLIAVIEGLTGRRVPDELVVMKHFQTVGAVTATFWKPTNPPE